MNEQRYFLKLSYKGTNYKGWQIQPNDKTVQGEINNTLSKLNNDNQVLSMGCGRTDTGVHASLFFAHFDFKSIIDVDQFKYKMNNMLPSDIVIHDLFKVEKENHSRYDATSRTYKYHIATEKNAFTFDSSLLITHLLDLKQMNLGCDIIKSYTDFECFSKVKTDVKTFECKITECSWVQHNHQLIFTITANRFLRNMVRSIVGTLLDVGNGKISLDQLHSIMKSKNRNNAGKSVLANGLFLTNIKYPYL